MVDGWLWLAGGGVALWAIWYFGDPRNRVRATPGAKINTLRLSTAIAVGVFLILFWGAALWFLFAR